MEEYQKDIENGYEMEEVKGRESLREEERKEYMKGYLWYGGEQMEEEVEKIKELRRIDGKEIMKNEGERIRRGIEEKEER